MCLDLKSFYLSVPLEQYKYMCIPIVENKPIRLVDQSGPRICLLGDETSSLGTPAGRNLGQQITAQAPCPQGILRVQADTQSMVTRYTPYFIRIGGK